MTLYKIPIHASPLKIFDIVFSKEGSSFFRDAKTYTSYTQTLDGMKASWGPVVIALQKQKPCSIDFHIKKRGMMRVDGTMIMNRHVAVFTYSITTWVPLYKKFVEKKMVRAIQDIGSIHSTH